MKADRGHAGICVLVLILTLGCGQSVSSNPILPMHELTGDVTKSSGDPWTTIEPEGKSVDLKSPSDPAVKPHWSPDPSEPYSVVVEEFYVTSANGNEIFADVHRPEFASPETPCHGLILVPGGTQKGDAWHAEYLKCGSNHLAAAGFLVMDFDFQGRGKSEGEEDYCGPTHREDLRAVIEYCAKRPDVLPGGIGLVTSSFGCTVASGTLASWPDLPVRFWIDKEGSQNRFVSTQWDDPFWVETWGGHDTSDIEFWREREAIRFQPHITVPYIRVQSDLDHALDYFYVDHAIAMVNAALSGESPYCRMNHNPPNIRLSRVYKDTYQYENVYHLSEALYDYVLEAGTMEF